MININYLYIILGGDPSERELTQYYYDEYQKNIIEGVKYEDFFSNLLDIISQFEDDLRAKYNSKKKQYHNMIDDAAVGVDYQFETEKEYNKFIKKCKKALKSITMDDFSVELTDYKSITPKSKTHWRLFLPLRHSEVEAHKKSILSALEKTKLHQSSNNNHKKNSAKNANSNLKDLFKTEKDYDNIVKLLIENGFIHENENDSLTWKGDNNDSGLKVITSLCTLGVLLDRRNYFRPNTKNIKITSALMNTFNLNISPQRYGVVKKGATHKSYDYESSFYFIKTL